MTEQPAATTPGPYTESFFQDGLAIIRALNGQIIARVETRNIPGWPGVPAANAKLFAASWVTARERDRLVAVNEKLVEALGLATQELISIRARDGAPQHIDWHRGQPIQTSSCTEEWWNELTEKCSTALAQARKPETEGAAG